MEIECIIIIFDCPLAHTRCHCVRSRLLVWCDSRLSVRAVDRTRKTTRRCAQLKTIFQWISSQHLEKRASSTQTSQQSTKLKHLNFPADRIDSENSKSKKPYLQSLNKLSNKIINSKMQFNWDVMSLLFKSKSIKKMFFPSAYWIILLLRCCRMDFVNLSELCALSTFEQFHLLNEWFYSAFIMCAHKRLASVSRWCHEIESEIESDFDLLSLEDLNEIKTIFNKS